MSGVQFQGLESPWNWFLVLEGPWFFIELDQKISTLISFKLNENQWKQVFKWTDYKLLEMLTKWVKTLVFCSQCSLVTLPGPYFEISRTFFFISIYLQPSKMFVSKAICFGYKHMQKCQKMRLWKHLQAGCLLCIRGSMNMWKVLEKSFNFWPEKVYDPCKSDL